MQRQYQNEDVIPQTQKQIELNHFIEIMNGELTPSLIKLQNGAQNLKEIKYSTIFYNFRPKLKSLSDHKSITQLN